MDKSFYGKIQAVIDNNEQLKNSYILKAVLESIEYKDEKSYLKDLEKRLTEVNDSLKNDELTQIISSISDKIKETEGNDLDSFENDQANEFDTKELVAGVRNDLGTAEQSWCDNLCNIVNNQETSGTPSYMLLPIVKEQLEQKLSYDCLKEPYNKLVTYLNENKEKLVLIDTIEYFKRMGVYAGNPKAAEILKECLFNKEYNPDAISMKMGSLAESKSIINMLDTLRAIRAEKTGSDTFDLSESKNDTNVYTYMGPILMEGASITMYVDGSFINITPEKKEGKDIKNVINEGSVFTKGDKKVDVNVYELTDLSVYKDKNQFYNTVKAFESLGFKLKKGGVTAQLNRSTVSFTLNENSNLDFYINSKKIDTITEAKNSDMLAFENTATKSCLYNVLENVNSICNVPFVKFLINEKLGKASMVINLSNDFFVYDFVGENKTNVYKLDAYKLYEFCKNEFGFDISSTFNFRIADKTSKLTKIEEDKKEILKTIESYKKSIAKIDEAKKMDLRESDVKELDELTRTLFEGIKTLQEKFGVLCDSEDSIRFSRKDAINEENEGGGDSEGSDGAGLEDGVNGVVDTLQGNAEGSGEESEQNAEGSTEESNVEEGGENVEPEEVEKENVEEEQVEPNEDVLNDQTEQPNDEGIDTEEDTQNNDQENPEEDMQAPEGEEQNPEEMEVEEQEVEEPDVEEADVDEMSNEGASNKYSKDEFIAEGKDGSDDDEDEDDGSDEDDDSSDEEDETFNSDDEDDSDEDNENKDTDDTDDDEVADEEDKDAVNEDGESQPEEEYDEDSGLTAFDYDDGETKYNIFIGSDLKQAIAYNNLTGEFTEKLPIEYIDGSYYIDPDGLNIPFEELVETNDGDKEQLLSDLKKKGLTDVNESLVNEGILDAFKIGLIKNARIRKALEEYEKKMLDVQNNYINDYVSKAKVKEQAESGKLDKSKADVMGKTFDQKMAKTEERKKYIEKELDSLVKEIKDKKPQASNTIDKVVAAAKDKVLKKCVETLQNLLNDPENNKVAKQIETLKNGYIKTDNEVVNAVKQESNQPDFSLGDGEILSQLNEKGEEIGKFKVVDAIGKNGDGIGLQFLDGNKKGKTEYFPKDDVSNPNKFKKVETEETQQQEDKQKTQQQEQTGTNPTPQQNNGGTQAAGSTQTSQTGASTGQEQKSQQGTTDAGKQQPTNGGTSTDGSTQTEKTGVSTEQEQKNQQGTTDADNQQTDTKENTQETQQKQQNV